VGLAIFQEADGSGTEGFGGQAEQQEGIGTLNCFLSLLLLSPAIDFPNLFMVTFLDMHFC
jgi:hypothetical protein